MPLHSLIFQHPDPLSELRLLQPATNNRRHLDRHPPRQRKDREPPHPKLRLLSRCRDSRHSRLDRHNSLALPKPARPSQPALIRLDRRPLWRILRPNPNIRHESRRCKSLSFPPTLSTSNHSDLPVAVPSNRPMDPRHLHQQPRRTSPTRRPRQGRSSRRNRDLIRNRSGRPASAESRRVQFFAAGDRLGLHGVCGVEVRDRDELCDRGGR